MKTAAMTAMICLASAIVAGVPTSAASPFDPVHPPEGITCPTGYNYSAFTNVCLTNNGVTLFDLEYHSYCVVGQIPCLSFPVIGDPTQGQGDPVGVPNGVFVTVLCNQPQGCGCSEWLTGQVVIICAPLFS